MNAPTYGPARLDYYVSERLAILHMTRAELARRGGPNRSTLHKSTTGSRSMSPATLARLDEALGWAHGSSRAILDGREPVTPQHHDTSVRTVLFAVEGLVEQCHAILADARLLVSELLARPDQQPEHAR
ncbi:MAG: helix-turn-helix domain-containing protein [Mycobacterium sp.]